MRCSRTSADVKLPSPFPRLSYDEAMARTAPTSPTCASAWRCLDSPTSCRTGVRRVQAGDAEGGQVRGLAVPGGERLAQADRRADGAREAYGAKGLVSFASPARAASKR